MCSNSESSEVPFFSIITVCRNNADTIKRTLDSVSRQAENCAVRVEHVIVDGGSCDGTYEAVLNYERSARENLSVTVLAEKDYQEPNGVYSAMNLALRHVRGRVVNFLNGDDALADKNVLDEIHEEFSKRPSAKAVFGNLERVDRQTGQTIKECRQKPYENPKQIQRGWMMQHQTLFLDAELAKDLSFDSRFRICADKDQQIRLIKMYPDIVIRHITTVLVRVSGGGISDTSSIWEREKENMEMLNSHFPGLLNGAKNAFYTAVKRLRNTKTTSNTLIKLLQKTGLWSVPRAVKVEVDPEVAKRPAL